MGKSHFEMMENETWRLTINTDIEPGSLVIDFIVNDQKTQDMHPNERFSLVNTMIVKDIQILESMLLMFFGFQDKEVEEVMSRLKASD